MWSLIPGPVKAALAAFGGVLLAFLTGGLWGKRKERQARKVKSVQDVLDAKEIEDEIRDMDAEERRRRLDADWMRDD